MNAQGSTARQQRTGRKHAQVLCGAREVFLRDGFEGASVDEIARCAGVSKATLYAYFPDKRFLFLEVARSECCRQEAASDEMIAMSAPPAEALRAAGERMLRMVLSPLGLGVFRICVAESARFPELGREFWESGPGRVRSKIVAYLRQASARGELAIDDADLAADQFAELCKAELFTKLVFGIQSRFSEAEIARVVDGAVATFLARYGMSAPGPDAA